LLKKIKTFILDTLFPISCLFCRKGQLWVCPECFDKIEILSDQVCPYCEKIASPAGRICPACKIKFLAKNKIIPFDSLIVSSSYKRSGLARLIHFYKYNFISGLSDPLGQLLTKALARNNLPLPDLIVPVPLHTRRLRWRGYNQSELLAGYIGDNLSPGFSIPMITGAIFRKRYTPPQMKIKNYQERKKNLENSFTAAENAKQILAGKKILLVDDIATTGSTLLECAKVLKLSGAEKVFGVVLARQEMEKRD
jgi:ComF family protein